MLACVGLYLSLMTKFGWFPKTTYILRWFQTEAQLNHWTLTPLFHLFGKNVRDKFCSSL